MKTVPTFTAHIHVGTKRHYDGQVRSIDVARGVLQKYVNAVGLCVTLTPTEYIYTDGAEPGFVIGLINYPRFPADVESIKAKAIGIAEEMLRAFEQFKVSVVFPDETVMVEEEFQDERSDGRAGTQEALAQSK